jgi:hypothetical protein
LTKFDAPQSKINGPHHGMTLLHLDKLNAYHSNDLFPQKQLILPLSQVQMSDSMRFLFIFQANIYKRSQNQTKKSKSINNQ